MKIALRGFLGEIPRLEPHRLPDINGAAAISTKLWRANVEPFRQPEYILALGKAGEKKAIYRFGQSIDSDTLHWFHWLNDTDVTRAHATSTDTDERTYYTEEGQPPRMTDASMGTGGAAMPVSFYRLGVPAPTNPGVATLSDPVITFNTTSGVDGTSDQILKTAHGLSSTQRVTYSNGGGGQNIGLTNNTTYWAYAPDADHFSLHTSSTDAETGANKVNLTGGGSETHSFTALPFGDAQVTYVGYTYVNSWGHEGPMSLVAGPINYYQGQTLTFASMLTGPVDSGYNITKKRVYVSQGDLTGQTVLRFWKEINLAVTSTSGTLDQNTLGSAAASPEPIPPPDDLFGLAAHPNGFCVGFSRTTRRFYRSEVFRPYAWPIEYSDSLDAEPVALCVIGSSVVIGTKGPTYLASGVDPLRTLPVKLEGKQPCVAKRTMQLTVMGVLYASPDGLVSVTPSGQMQLVTRELFTYDQWQALNPSSMWAVVHDERYYLFWQASGANRGLLIFDFTGDGLGVVRSSLYATAGYADPRRDALFLTLPADNQLYRWDTGSGYLTYRWRSKTFTVDGRTTIGCAMVAGEFGDGRTTTFRLIGDGVEQFSRVVNSDTPFQLPRTKRFRQVALEVEGTAPVREILAASDMEQLGEMNG